MTIKIAVIALVGVICSKRLCGQDPLTVDSVISRLPLRVHALGELISAGRLSDGTIFLGEVHSGALLLLRDGRAITVGQRGDEAGHFEHLSWMSHCSRDSIYTWDLVRRRMLVFSNTGDFVREDDLQAGNEDSAPFTVACGRAGFVTQSLPRNFAGLQPFIRGNALVSIRDSRGTVVGAIDRISSDELVLFGGGASPRPLGKRTSLAIGTDRVFVGTADSTSIDMYGLDGTLLGKIRTRAEVRKPSRKDYEQDVLDLAALAPPSVSPRIAQQLLAVPMPDELPPYQSLIVDSEDYLWVLLSAPADSQTIFDVYGRAGALMGRVILRGHVKVTDIGADYILAFEPSPAGIDLLTYRLVRGKGWSQGNEKRQDHLSQD